MYCRCASTQVLYHLQILLLAPGQKHTSSSQLTLPEKMYLFRNIGAGMQLHYNEEHMVDLETLKW